MALTLDDIIGAPSDPDALNRHAMDRGWIPTPEPAKPLVPPAAVTAPMSAVAAAAPEMGVKPMSPVTLGGPVRVPSTEPINPARGEPTTIPPLSMGAGLGGSVNVPNEQPVNPARGTPIKPLSIPTTAADYAGAKAQPTWGALPAKDLGGAMEAPAAPELGGATAPGTIGGPVSGLRDVAASPGRPEVNAKPGTQQFWMEKLAQDNWDATHGYGTEMNHPGTGGKIAHVLSRIGQTAADILAPGITSAIPGTERYRQLKEAGETAQLGKAQERELATAREKSAEQTADVTRREGEQRLREGEQRLTKAETEYKPNMDTQGNVTGWTDALGRTRGLNDPETPQGIKDVAAATEAKANRPTIEKMDNGDVVAITPGKNGQPPTSQVVYQGDPKVETELTEQTINGKEHKVLINKKNGEVIKDIGAFAKPESPTAGLAQMKANEELIRAFVKGPDGKEHGELMTREEARAQGIDHVEKAQPGDREKAVTHTTVLNTLQTQLNTVANASKALDQNLFQRGIIAQALSHPSNTTIDNAMRAAVMVGASPATQDYVQAVIALREAGLALPKEITGGSRVSEVQASALWQGMPSATSLDSKYAIKQAKKFQSDIDRLRDRADKVRGIEVTEADPLLTGKGGNKPAGQPPAARPGFKMQQNKKTGEYREVPVNQ
jgi:hypothetical protein